MPAHETDADLQVLLDRFVGQLEHPARARAVHGGRFLHEDVDAALDGIREMDPAKGGRRGKDGDVARPQAVDRLLVGIEADEHAVGGHLDLLGEFLVQMVMAALEFLRKDIGHGDQLDRPVLDRQGVFPGAGAAAAAADQGHLDGITLGGMHLRDCQSRQGRGHSGLTRLRNQFAARHAAAHSGSPSRKEGRRKRVCS